MFSIAALCCIQKISQIIAKVYRESPSMAFDTRLVQGGRSCQHWSTYLKGWEGFGHMIFLPAFWKKFLAWPADGHFPLLFFSLGINFPTLCSARLCSVAYLLAAAVYTFNLSVTGFRFVGGPPRQPELLFIIPSFKSRTGTT